MKLNVASAAGAATGLACLAALFASTNAELPNPWPNMHVHTEIMFTVLLDTIHLKPIYYNFPAGQYRADLFWITGGIPLQKNFSSVWLQNDLYMITYEPGPASCVHLNLGFGMMTPNWFLTGPNMSTMPDMWQGRRTEEWAVPAGLAPLYPTEVYHHVNWQRKDGAGQGWFDYMSLYDTGDAFRLTAPSPTGIVVNEHYNFSAVSSFDPSIFALPSNPSCTNATALGGKAEEEAWRTALWAIPELRHAAHQAGVTIPY